MRVVLRNNTKNVHLRPDGIYIHPKFSKLLYNDVALLKLPVSLVINKSLAITNLKSVRIRRLVVTDIVPNKNRWPKYMKNYTVTLLSRLRCRR